jgi:c-di-AMP phosphodiesterase-like protein
MPEKKVFRIRYYLLIPGLVFFIYLLLFYFFDNKITTDSIFISLGIAVVLALVLPYRVKSAFRSRVINAIKKSGKETILSPTQLMIDEKGIFGQNKVAEVKYKWDAFTKKVVANNCCYLYTNLIQAVVIPFRAFQTKEEKEKFDSLLSQYLSFEVKFSTIPKK